LPDDSQNTLRCLNVRKSVKYGVRTGKLGGFQRNPCRARLGIFCLKIPRREGQTENRLRMVLNQVSTRLGALDDEGAFLYPNAFIVEEFADQRAVPTGQCLKGGRSAH
jgi:hypothetical protein